MAISPLKRNIIKASTIAAVVCLAYVLWISPLRPFNLLSLKITDAYYLLNDILRPSDKIIKDAVIISVDDESMKEMNLRWPWPRGMIAEIVEKMRLGGPAAVYLDLIFFGESVNRDEDLKLAKAIKDAGNVFVGAYVGADGRYILPDKLIAQSAAGTGSTNKPRDVDNMIRRMEPLFRSASGNIIDYSLSAKVAARILNRPVGKMISKAPLLKDDTAYLYYFGNMDRFTRVPAWKVLKNEVNTSAFKGKMVFIGATSEILHDNHPTPFGIMPGVVMAANEVNAFLTGRYFYSAGNVLNFAILFIFVFIVIFSWFSFPVARAIAISIAEAAIFPIFCFILFFKGIIIDPFGGIFMVVSISVVMYGKRHIILALENLELRKEAITDGLTGLYLYRYFELQIKRYLKNPDLEKDPLVLAIYDIDHFKQINDVYGHEFGNLVLKTAAKIIKDNVRRHDVVARYGGDEFCVLMKGTSVKNARLGAERVISNVKRETFSLDKGKKTVNITMSAGIVSSENCSPKNPSDFVKAADSALYRSKREGRDRLSVFRIEDSEFDRRIVS